MLQLVITVIAIALTAAMLLISISYLPWWHRPAQDIEATTRTSLTRVEQAFDLLAHANQGVPPAPTADADGGFEAHFQPVMKLLPAVPGGFSWSYGQKGSGQGLWTDMHYVCLSSNTVNKAAWIGINRALAQFSTQQAIVSDTCGATSSVNEPPTTTLAVTFYLVHTPGIDR